MHYWLLQTRDDVYVSIVYVQACIHMVHACISTLINTITVFIPTNPSQREMICCEVESHLPVHFPETATSARESFFIGL